MRFLFKKNQESETEELQNIISLDLFKEILSKIIELTHKADSKAFIEARKSKNYV